MKLTSYYYVIIVIHILMIFLSDMLRELCVTCNTRVSEKQDVVHTVICNLIIFLVLF